MGMVRNITRETYTKAAVSFCDLNDGIAYEVSLEPFLREHDQVNATEREWGAWYAYFTAKGISTRVMKRQAEAGKPFTVPARWPNEFDADWTMAQDMESANQFMAVARRRFKRVHGFEDENKDRAEVVKRVMARARQKERLEQQASYLPTEQDTAA